MIHTNCYRFKENCWKKAYAEENVLGCPSDEGQSWKIKFQRGQKNEWVDYVENKLIKRRRGNLCTRTQNICVHTFGADVMVALR